MVKKVYPSITFHHEARQPAGARSIPARAPLPARTAPLRGCAASRAPPPPEERVESELHCVSRGLRREQKKVEGEEGPQGR